MIGFFTPPRFVFGPGAIEQLSALDARRALVVADPALRGPTTERVVEELAKSECSVELFDGVVVDPTVASVTHGVERARAHAPEWIVALGGGSAIDTAKAVWVGYGRGDLALSDVGPLTELNLRAKARFVAIPTTSGSGAESSWTAHVRTDSGDFLELASRELVSDWALLDPMLARSVPPERRAECGAEALAHAMEAVASEWATPITDALAREAVGELLPTLPRSVKHPEDDEARATMHYGASMAGLAAANSQLGLAQAIAQALRGPFRIPHGRLLAVALPYVAEFNFPSARHRYAGLSPLIGPASLQTRAALADRLRGSLEGAGLPRTLPQAGVEAAELQGALSRLVETIHRSPTAIANPRVASPDEIRRLLTTMVEGGPVTF